MLAHAVAAATQYYSQRQNVRHDTSERTGRVHYKYITYYATYDIRPAPIAHKKHLRRRRHTVAPLPATHAAYHCGACARAGRVHVCCVCVWICRCAQHIYLSSHSERVRCKRTHINWDDVMQRECLNMYT